MSDRAAHLITLLGLAPHPEGGHYREVHRSTDRVQHGPRNRSAVTTIYFLLRAGQFSRWHVVASDEIWHFYEGDGFELVTFDPDTRRIERVALNRPSASSTAVHVVPAGHWQAARPLGAYGLAGCVVAPGFEFEDFRFVADLPGHQAVFEGPLADHRGLL